MIERMTALQKSMASRTRARRAIARGLLRPTPRRGASISMACNGSTLYHEFLLRRMYWIVL